MKQIGILGGTFDPVHNGHIMLAKAALWQFELDEIWFMPAPNPPHKTDRHISGFEHRFRMLEAAAGENPAFVCSDFELHRNGRSYSSDTLKELSELYPDYSFSFIMGADSLYEIETWHEPEKVMKLARLLVAGRDYEKQHEELDAHAKYLRDKYNADIDFIIYQEVDISSGMLRELVASGRSISRYVPEAVDDYIKENNLYKWTEKN